MSEPYLEHDAVTDDRVGVGYPAARPAGTDLRLGSGARPPHTATVQGPVHGSAGRYRPATVLTGLPV
jgi:hypothetical protein